MTDSDTPQSVLEKRAAAQKWREEKADQYRKALRSSVLGLEIVVFILVGGGLGYYVDNKYGTTPWAFWTGSFFGVAGAIKTMVVMVREYNKADAADAADSADAAKADNDSSA